MLCSLAALEAFPSLAVVAVAVPAVETFGVDCSWEAAAAAAEEEEGATTCW
jgi:hypothetical protein